MILTEHLQPGDGADRKPSVGTNIPEIYATTAEIPPELRKPAMQAVAGRAVDAADARSLLEHLGLIDPCTPKAQWRRANKPKAAP
jgi:hypothetical protein